MKHPFAQVMAHLQLLGSGQKPVTSNAEAIELLTQGLRQVRSALEGLGPFLRESDPKYEFYSKELDDASALLNEVKELAPFDWSEIYENGECPDCGDDIPANTPESSECKNCGHVF